MLIRRSRGIRGVRVSPRVSVVLACTALALLVVFLRSPSRLMGAAWAPGNRALRGQNPAGATNPHISDPEAAVLGSKSRSGPILTDRERSIRLPSGSPPAAPAGIIKEDITRGGAQSAAVPAVGGGDEECGEILEGTEMGGDVVKWGKDHIQDTASGCCHACAAEPRCNV